MMTAKDVARVFEEIAPLTTGIAGDQLGFVHGDPDVPVIDASFQRVYLFDAQPRRRASGECL